MRDWKAEWEEYLAKKGWKYKTSPAHNAFILIVCPKCGEGKSGEGTNNFYAYFHGGFVCHKCCYKGNLFDLKRDQGDLRETTSLAGKHRKRERIFSRPESDLLDKTTQNNDIKETVFAWFEKERKITRDTLNYFKIGVDTTYKHARITFPYFYNGELVNIKYRTKNKEFAQIPNARKPFFNIDNINPEKPVLLCEGEIDAMSYWQYGFTNVLSIPSGAKNFDADELLPLVEGVKSFLISYDSDSAGFEGSMRAAGLLGIYRCKFINLPEKDINECLQKGYSKNQIEQLIKEAKAEPHKDVKSISDFRDELKKRYADPQIYEGFKTGWEKLDEKIGGIRLAETSIVTGHTGQGKTSFCLELAYRLAYFSKLPVLICSFENKPHEAAMTVLSIHNERQSKGSHELIDKACDELENSNIYLLNLHGAHDWGVIEDSCRYAIYQYGVAFILFDNLQFFVKITDDRFERRVYEEVITNTDKMASNEGVHCMMVSHPKKESMEVELTGVHCKGSGAIQQVAQLGITVKREYGCSEYNSKITIWKVRDDSGDTGIIYSRYDRDKKRFYEVSAYTADEVITAQDNADKGKKRTLKTYGTKYEKQFDEVKVLF